MNPGSPAAELARPEVYSIQLLRGVAALLVVLYHFAHYLRFSVPGTDLGFVLFSEGYVGVDIFFLISGFIIVYSTDRPGHAQPVDFALRRFFRVVPLAQLATLVYFRIISAHPSVRLLWKSLFFYPRLDYDAPKFGFPVVPQEWTLTYELLFYGIFGGVLVFTHRRRVVAVAVVLVACVLGFQWALGGPVSLYPNRVYLPPAYDGVLPPELLGTLGNPILLEFIVGMALAVAYRRWEARLRREQGRRARIATGVLLLAVFVHDFCSQFDSGNGLLNKGSAAAALVTGALLLEVSVRRPTAADLRGRGLRALLWLGAVSYPLYLLHSGIAERSLRFVCSYFLQMKVAGAWGFVGLLAMSLVLAGLAHHYLELPLVRAGKYLVEARRRSTLPIPRHG